MTDNNWGVIDNFKIFSQELTDKDYNLESSQIRIES